MKTIFLCGILILFFPLQSRAQWELPFWELVGMGHLIVEGELDVPIDEIRKIKSGGKDGYIQLRIIVRNIVKGKWNKKTLIFKKHTKKYYADGISINRLIRLHEKRVVAFIGYFADDLSKGNYFLIWDNPQALQVTSEDLIDRINNEIKEQKRQHRASIKFAISNQLPLEGKVKQLIEVMVDKSTKPKRAQAVYQEMMSLGEKAVPAIIKHLDDRRPLASPYIMLEVQGGFESIVHYGPETVLDVLTIILNNITHKFLSRLHNGGSEIQRESAVKLWRVYERRTYGNVVKH